MPRSHKRQRHPQLQLSDWSPLVPSTLRVAVPQNQPAALVLLLPVTRGVDNAECRLVVARTPARVAHGLSARVAVGEDPVAASRAFLRREPFPVLSPDWKRRLPFRYRGFRCAPCHSTASAASPNQLAPCGGGGEATTMSAQNSGTDHMGAETLPSRSMGRWRMTAVEAPLRRPGKTFEPQGPESFCATAASCRVPTPAANSFVEAGPRWPWQQDCRPIARRTRAQCDT
jgi:hypothetical protein